jgi:molybdopterin synthase sulfur carrier subunit
MIRVALPAHLQTLARCEPEVRLEAGPAPSLGEALAALEERYPVLRGTLRDHGTGKRRPFVRFFAAGEDFSLRPPTEPLPAAVAAGREPLLIVGAIAGG